MKFINGVTFGFMNKRGEWDTAESYDSLKLLKERTGANTVILAVVAEQDKPWSTEIHYQDDWNLSDDEVVKMIRYAQSLGLQVILKPMVNVSDGAWRAYINFFDHDVPVEPTWHDWFVNYNAYILHYADMAQKTGCEMLVIGCELVNADRRDSDWRALIAKVRTHYKGLITYNCDKFQEDNLTWWDAVDVISSSGYYSVAIWEEQLNRIEKVVQKYEKPFFFCEVGCASRTGSEFLPNDWQFDGETNLESQATFYKTMFAACEKRDWVGGFGIWDWKAHIYDIKAATIDNDYAIYGKPAERIIKENFAKRLGEVPYDE
ncbi:hypothetical protein Hs30E_18570 [Lactococcus hodotermopsidis]|uniref:1,4-beta-xylanase n=1 Tax=Pseudolactococcus hodotermopsidis TaxID=2709157 RepID=A0A6A0BEV3_9LACT|nr:1,4-beta-xylanase [Lactococcus hodotermopsidis]GFH43306.1 hypothetical protein Hs30E_18570 [Lactococcus hodotermopsidis]